MLSIQIEEKKTHILKSGLFGILSMTCGLACPSVSQVRYTSYKQEIGEEIGMITTDQDKMETSLHAILWKVHRVQWNLFPVYRKDCSFNMPPKMKTWPSLEMYIEIVLCNWFCREIHSLFLMIIDPLHEPTDGPAKWVWFQQNNSHEMGEQKMFIYVKDIFSLQYNINQYIHQSNNTLEQFTLLIALVCWHINKGCRSLMGK